MSSLLSKKDAISYLDIEGKVRGAAFQTDANFIKSNLGQTGLGSLEEEFKRLGISFSYENISAMRWYRIGYRNLELELIKDVFNWTDTQIIQMGIMAPKHSFLVKLLMKHFISPNKAIQKTSEYWDKHNTIGKLDVLEFNENHTLIIEITDFPVGKTYCRYLQGYFITISRLLFSLDSEIEVQVQELQCISNDEDSHIFKIIWGEK